MPYTAALRVRKSGNRKGSGRGEAEFSLDCTGAAASFLMCEFSACFGRTGFVYTGLEPELFRGPSGGAVMLRLFRSPRFRDPELGTLESSRGLWRGSAALYPGVGVTLALAGSRTEPDPAALRAASDLIAQFPSLRALLEKALFEHYEPYAQALAAGELEVTGEPLPKLAGPSEVWPHVSPVFLSVMPLNGVLTAELGLAAAWDEEHTLGARFQAGKFVELCGSVLSP